jgi:hypothetical protein
MPPKIQPLNLSRRSNTIILENTHRLKDSTEAAYL